MFDDVINITLMASLVVLIVLAFSSVNKRKWGENE